MTCDRLRCCWLWGRTSFLGPITIAGQLQTSAITTHILRLYGKWHQARENVASPTARYVPQASKTKSAWLYKQESTLKHSVPIAAHLLHTSPTVRPAVAATLQLYSC